MLARIDAWCAATGTKETALGYHLFKHWGFVGLLRKRLTVKAATAAAVARFLDDNPLGLPAPTLEREPGATGPMSGSGCDGQGRTTATERESVVVEAPAAAAPGEEIDASSPGRMIAGIIARWPDQWARVRAVAAELGLLPGEALFRAIEAGLDCLEEAERAEPRLPLAFGGSDESLSLPLGGSS